MARFPTFDEYRDKPAKGIQRCDELLKRSPDNIEILLTRLQLELHADNTQAAEQSLHLLYTRQSPILDIREISIIEEAAVELANHAYPTPLTAGPEIAKLWDAATKASSNTNHKLDLQSLRFSRAIIDGRTLDAQQSLIQLKALLPKNRVFYMAHAALTQQLSVAKDDLQSRLALMLAKKAVNENFDEDKSLDCRVSGQIFALQASQKDIEGILGRPFADSKQVFDTQRRLQSNDNKNTEVPASLDASSLPPKEWLIAELSALRMQFSSTIAASHCEEAQLVSFTANAVRLFTLATQSLSLQAYRPLSEAIFLAISSLVKAWTLNPSPSYLLQSAFLAESLLRLQTKVHEAKVILVYLYTRLGLGSLAYREWDSLSIKEVQYDTIGHAFLAKLSITHPHYLGDIEPLRLITHALGVYRRCEDKLAETHADVLSHGQTGMIFDLHELRQCLKLSTTRRILILEQRRLARLQNKPLNEHFPALQPRLTAAWLDMKDTRDFSSAFDYGYSVERALHGQNDAEPWILMSLAADCLSCFVGNQKALVQDIPQLLKQIQSLKEQKAAYNHEWLVSELIVLLLASTLHSTVSPAADLKDKVLSAIDALHIEALTKESCILPLHIRSVFLYLDTLRITAAYCKFADEKMLQRADAAAIRSACTKDFALLQAYCKSRASSVNAGEVKTILDSGSSESLEELVQSSTDETRTFCASMAESTKNAWAGAAQYRL